MTPSRHSAECRVASIRPATVDGLPTCRARRDAWREPRGCSSNVTTFGTRSSGLRQPCLAQPINMMLGILGVLVDGKTFPAFNCETRVYPQRLRGLGSRFLKLA